MEMLGKCFSIVVMATVLAACHDRRHIRKIDVPAFDELHLNYHYADSNPNGESIKSPEAIEKVATFLSQHSAGWDDVKYARMVYSPYSIALLNKGKRVGWFGCGDGYVQFEAAAGPKIKNLPRVEIEELNKSLGIVVRSESEK